MKHFLLLLLLFLVLPLGAAAQWEVRMNGLPANPTFQNAALGDSTSAWIESGLNLWHTTNLGMTWTLVPIPKEAEWPWVMAPFSRNTLLLGSDGGGIVRTTDAGAHWSVVFADSNVTHFINDLVMFDSLHGFAMGDPPDTTKHPGLLKTSDGGATWQVVVNDLPVGDIQSRDRTSFIRPNVGWTRVWNDGIYKTTNGGVNWVRIYTPHNSETIFFLNDSVGFFQSFVPLGLFRTADGGVTWSQAIFNATIYWVRWAPQGKLLWAGADSVFMSADLGKTWQLALTNRAFGISGSFQDARFFKDDIGLLAGMGIVLALVPPSVPELAFPPNRAYVLGLPRLNWHSLDGASRYHLQLSTDSLLRSNFLLNDSTLTDTTRWAYPIDSSYHGPIKDSLYWRVRAHTAHGWTPWSDTWRFIMTDDEVQEHDGLPSTYSLEQNYPNPFNPSTSIRYALPRRSHVTLTVFNALGQQVASLVNGEVEAGYHEVTFSASGFASGIYFYQLSAGDSRQTRKLCLIK